MTLEELTTLEKLNAAFYKCAKPSFWKESTQRYKSNLLINNVKLQEDLRTGQYTTSKTIDFTINERGKIRQINAPAIRDRIIQKILCQEILIPQLTKPLVYDNYASLKNRGTSFARKRLNVLLHRYLRRYGSDGYILQIDIKKYFNSIDHEILKQMIRERINESKDIMDLIDYIIDTSSDSNKGLNLGAEAPQIFAIYYLSNLDNYIKTVKGVKFYGRYMDDMFIFSNNKQELNELLRDIKYQLAKVKLEINERKTHITKLSHGFTFMQVKYNIVGQRVIKRPTRKKIVRERRRIKRYKDKYDNQILDFVSIYNAYKSWRNSVLKDCPQSKRSIRCLDQLFIRLFPEVKLNKKESREYLIQQTLRDSEVRECIQLN